MNTSNTERRLRRLAARKDLRIHKNRQRFPALNDLFSVSAAHTSGLLIDGLALEDLEPFIAAYGTA